MKFVNYAEKKEYTETRVSAINKRSATTDVKYLTFEKERE